MGRFIALKKEAEFIGKAAAMAEKEQGGTMRLRTFVVDARDADVIGDEAIWLNGEVKGWVTSGGYAHGSSVSVAMGYVPWACANEDNGWEIEILGERRSAKLQIAPLFDPKAERMRG
jgi:dimethylglycine dehydrogenase